MNRSGEAGRGSLAAEWYAAGLFAAYALLMFGHQAAPSLTDYANWTYQGVLLRDHLLGRADPQHWLKPYPVPNSAATVGIAFFALMLPWALAAKAWLCVQLGLSFVCLRHLLHTLGAKPAVWLVVPQAVFLNVNFWYGFVNFELGLAWMMLMASLMLRRIARDELRDWPIGALLVIAFFTHMMPFAFCVLLVLFYARQTGRWRLLWQLLPSSTIALWYVAARFLIAGNADGQAGMQASVQNYSSAFWAFKVNSYLKSFGFVNPESYDFRLLGPYGLAALFSVNLVLAATMAWIMFRAASVSLRQGDVTRFLWLSILLMLPVYLLAPGETLGISDPGARLLQCGLSMALVLGLSNFSVVGKMASACSIPMTALGLYLFAFLGFGRDVGTFEYAPLPHLIVEFARVPSQDQDYFYDALGRGDMRLKVFPTGMFLNKKGVIEKAR